MKRKTARAGRMLVALVLALGLATGMGVAAVADELPEAAGETSTASEQSLPQGEPGSLPEETSEPAGPDVSDVASEPAEDETEAGAEVAQPDEEGVDETPDEPQQDAADSTEAAGQLAAQAAENAGRLAAFGPAADGVTPFSTMTGADIQALIDGGTMYINITEDVVLTEPLRVDVSPPVGSRPYSVGIFGGGRLIADGDFYQFEITRGHLRLEDMSLVGGRGVYLMHGASQTRITMYRTSFLQGAGMYINGGINQEVHDCFFDGTGGPARRAIRLEGDAHMSMSDTVIQNFAGGGISVENSRISVFDCSLINNQAERGGAIEFVSDSGQKLNPIISVFSGNSAEYGGAIYMGGSAVLESVDVKYENNTAVYDGGAVYLGGNVQANMRVDVFTSNTAGRDGGGVYMGPSAVLEASVRTTANRAARNGGMIYVDFSSIHNLEVTDWSTFAQNVSGQRYKMVDPAHIGLHDTYVQATTFTGGARYGYNNHDIAYVLGTPVGFTVTFNVNGGSPAPAEPVIEVDTGDLIPAPATPAKEGHTFTGWYEGTERWVFTDTTDESGMPIAAMPMPARHLTLVAGYQINTYRLTFDYGYNSYKEEHPVVYGQTYTRPPQPNRQGYSFDGWFDEGGSLWMADSATMPAGNVTYTARWTQLATSTVSEPSESSQVVAPSSSESENGGGEEPGPAPSSSSAPVVSSSRPAVSSSRPVVSSGSSAVGSGVSSAAEGSSAAPAPTTSGAGNGESAGQDSVSSQGGAAGGRRGYDADGGRGEPGDEDYVEPGGVMSVFGSEMPLGGFASRGGWSLVNLLLALIMLASAVQMAVRMWLRRGRRQDSDILRPAASGAGLWRALYVAVGVLPAVLLFPLENFRYGMMLLSRWTPLFLCLTVAHIALGILAFARGRKAKAK